MVGPVYEACKECSLITDFSICPECHREMSKNKCKKCGYKREKNTCPRCGGETSEEWQGFLAVVDFEKSEIAKKMGISDNGRYALKVRK